MSQILEIPVIHMLNDLDKEFIQSLQVSTDRSYRGFRHIEFEIDKEKSVYFYILDKQEDYFTQSIWDRTIPRAPFTLFLVEEINHTVRDLITQYERKYATPYFIFIPFDKSVEDKSNDLAQEDNESVFYFNSDEENGVIKTLLNALKQFTERREEVEK